MATPALAHLVVPLSVAILLGLFILQRFGSGTIGWLFGPIILIWFVVIGLIGLVLFGAAVVCILDRPTLGCVLVGLLGVLFMAPWAFHLLDGGSARRSR